MVEAYPVVFSKGDKYVVAHVPDFNIGTQGTSISDAIKMARDAICLTGVDMQNEGESLPTPSDLDSVRAAYPGDIVTLVDADFDDYRHRQDLRTVKKNCTVPAWLCYAAEDAGINFSAVLTSALKDTLRLSNP